MDQAVSCNGLQIAHVRGPSLGPGKGPLDPAHLRLALDRLQERHPLLRVRILPHPRAHFADDERVPIPLRIAPGASWLSEAEDELNRPFPPDQAPLWRATLIPCADGNPEDSVLILSHHHVLADARTAANQVRDTLQDVACLLTGAALPPVEPLPLTAPLAALLPRRGLALFPAMNSYLLRSIGARLRGWPRKLRLEGTGDGGMPSPAQRRTRLLHHVLPATQTAALGERARREGTTVQGALGAALLLAVAQDMGLSRPATVGCFSTVSLRDELLPDPVHGPVGEAVGLYVSQVTTFHRLWGERPFWDLAREFRAALVRAKNAGEAYMTFPWLGLFIPGGPDPGPGLVRRIDMAAPAAVGITNVGRLALPVRYGPLRLHRLHIAIGAALVAPLVAGVTTLDGQLSCNLMHVEPLLPGGRARAIQDAMMGLLRASALVLLVILGALSLSACTSDGGMDADGGRGMNGTSGQDLGGDLAEGACVTSFSCPAAAAEHECGVATDEGQRHPDRGAPYCADKLSRKRCSCDLIRCRSPRSLCAGTYKATFRQRLLAGCDGTPGQHVGTCQALWDVVEMWPGGEVLSDRGLLNVDLDFTMKDYSQTFTLTEPTQVRLVVEQYCWLQDVQGVGNAGRGEVNQVSITRQ
jgi:hypothetical protein